MAISSPTKSVVSGKPAKTVLGVKLSTYQQNKAFAEQMSGYNSTSPIWGKQLPEVLDMIDAETDPNTGNPARIVEITQELRRRIAKGRLMKAQRP